MLDRVDNYLCIHHVGLKDVPHLQSGGAEMGSQAFPKKARTIHRKQS